MTVDSSAAVDVYAPPPNAFVHRLTVAAADIDALEHANNLAWLRWVIDAAVAHAVAVGQGFAELQAQNVAWVVRRHEIEYLLPAFLGEQLEAVTWPETLRGVTSIRRTVFRRGAQLLGRASTTWVMIDSKTQKPARIPKAVLAAYGVEVPSRAP